MLKNERFIKIEELVNEKKFVSLQELINLLSSSESTIRADLVALEKEGKLIRVHGGAQALDAYATYEPSFDEKENLQTEEKKIIGKYAATLIKDNYTVYIDAGTTTSAIIDYLPDVKATFVTNSPIIGKKIKKRGYKVYVTGGEIKLSTDAFIGAFAFEIISNFTFDIGFFGTNGISLTEGLTTPDYEEAIIKQSALSRCKRKYILADDTKFDIVSTVRFHNLENIEIITNKIPDKKFNKNNIKEVR